MFFANNFLLIIITLSYYDLIAEAERFELPVHYCTLVFKTNAIDHSAKLPTKPTIINLSFSYVD